MVRLLGNLSLLLFTVLLCLLLAELVVRAIPSPLDSIVNKRGRTKVRFNPYRPDGTLGYVLRPDWETIQEGEEYSVRVTTNSLGLRGASAPARKPPGAHRILVVGDSFAFGYGVEDWESFPARLEIELGNTSPSVEVLNAGVPGWSADSYLVLLRQHGFALEPDLVILAISENDIGDLAWNRLTLDADRLPVRIESTLRMIDHRGRMRYLEGGPLTAPDLDFPGSNWLADHSQLFHLLRFRVAKTWIAMRMRSAEESQRQRAGAPPTGPISSLSEAEIQRGLLSGKAFQLRYHRYLVDAIRRACADRGIALRLLVVASPAYPEKGGWHDRTLHEDCRLDPACLDSADLFTGASAPETYFPIDGHWTAEGHARVARALSAWLLADDSLRLAP
jgi:lysophospholipase L1-like esterase